MVRSKPHRPALRPRGHHGRSRGGRRPPSLRSRPPAPPRCGPPRCPHARRRRHLGTPVPGADRPGGDADVQQGVGDRPGSPPPRSRRLPGPRRVHGQASWSTPYGTSRRAGPTSHRPRRVPCWPNSARARHRGPSRPYPRAWASHRVRLHTEFPTPHICMLNPNNLLGQRISLSRRPRSRLLLQKTFRKCNRVWDSLRLGGRVAVRPLPTGRGSN